MTINQGHIDISALGNEWYQNLDYRAAEIDHELLSKHYALEDCSYATWSDQRAMLRCFDVPDHVQNHVYSEFKEIQGLDAGFAVHNTVPGTIVPIHGDHYQYLMSKNPNKTIDDVTRYVVFIEDRRPGHIIEVSGILLADWKAGD